MGRLAVHQFIREKYITLLTMLNNSVVNSFDGQDGWADGYSLRVTQLYYRTRYKKEHYDTWPPLMKMLSTRPKNALTNYFRNENILDNPQKIAGLGRVKLAKIKNLGRRSVKEIAFALHAIGYMDSW
ncbi:MAG: hypothetical protein U9R02_03270 [Thermodesulfobacteriota bacterium]|nr:hypothetical protein [Thermodesulfobacteriota bacterium]